MQMIMYRTESAYGSGVRDIVKVLTFEIFELGNTDILEYVYNNYKLDSKGEAILLELFNNWEDYASDTEERQTEGVTQFVNALNRYFGVKLKYCLWLADLSAVKELYEGTDDDILAFGCSPYKLNDLGQDGKLFAYTELPEPIGK